MNTTCFNISTFNRILELEPSPIVAIERIIKDVGDQFDIKLADLLIGASREFSDDEYNKLADYYIWTMLPFGRMLRDVAHPEKSIFFCGFSSVAHHNGLLVLSIFSKSSGIMFE